MADTTIHAAVGIIARRLLENESSELRRMCEIAVMDLDPGMTYPGEMDDVRLHMTAEQARHAVAAVVATLGLHEKLPNEVMTW